MPDKDGKVITMSHNDDGAYTRQHKEKEGRREQVPTLERVLFAVAIGKGRGGSTPSSWHRTSSSSSCSSMTHFEAVQLDTVPARH